MTDHAKSADERKTKKQLVRELKSLRRKVADTDQPPEELIRIYKEVPIGLCYFDTHLRYKHINDWLAAINGAPVEQHLGRTIREVIPDVSAGVESQLRHVIETGEPILGGTIEAETPAQPGRKMTFQHSYYPVKSSDDTVVGVSCVVENITDRKQADEALRKSEQRFKDLVDVSSDWFWEMGPDIRFTWLSEGHQTKTHMNDKSVIGKTRWELSAEEGEEAKWAAHRADLEAHQPFQNLSYRLRTDKGDVEYRSVSGVPIFDVLGNFQGYRGTARDITRWRQTEDALRRAHNELERRVEERTRELRQSEAQLRLVTDNLPVLISYVDSEERFRFVNAACETWFGRPREEIVGKLVKEIFAGSEYPKLQPNIAAVLSGRAVTFQPSVTYPDGTPRDVEVVLVPDIAEGERVRGYFALVQDITERKRGEQELARSQFALDHASDAAIWLDLDGRIVYANAATCIMLGYSREELLTLRVPDYDPDASLKDFSLSIERIKARGPYTFEARHLTKAGNDVPVEVSVHFMRFGDDEMICSYSRDITERKRVAERARRHQGELAHVLRLRTMGEMAATLAHELNQPLAAVVNYSRACIRGVRSGKGRSEDICKTLDRITEQARRAGNIVQRVRGLMQRSDAKRSRLHVNEIVKAVATLALADAHEHDVLLRFDFGNDIASVSADMVEIEQVVLNLTRNAIEAMTKTQAGKRELTIETSMAGDDAVQLTVRDTGPGIPAENADRVFEPFFTTKPKGLGMGLAISRSIVEAHGGRLTATRNGDRGSTFRIILPAVQKPPKTGIAVPRLDSPSVSRELPAATSGEPTVFIVDDDEAARESLRSLVESVGLTAETYATAQQFLDAYEPRRPGCLVLDLRMPEMSGLDLQQELANREIDIPVAFVTGYGNVQEAIRALKAGAVDFIEKPFDDHAVLDRIRDCLALDSRRRRLRDERAGVVTHFRALTPRERETMALVVAGNPNKVIAEKLGIRPKTVENHRARVMRKMKAASLADLVRMSASLE